MELKKQLQRLNENLELKLKEFHVNFDKFKEQQQKEENEKILFLQDLEQKERQNHSEEVIQLITQADNLLKKD